MSAETQSSPATRPSLLARLKDWSRQTAWREFNRDYAPLIRNVARKAGLTDAEADEVAQETLIAVAKKVGAFEHAGNRGSFRAWLYQQARWRIADQFRARARLQGRGEMGCHDADSSVGASLQLQNEHCETRIDVTERQFPHWAEIDQGNAADTGYVFPKTSSPAPPEVDPAFEHLWDAEWQEHIRQAALQRVKRRVTARQFQLFDLHALQGMSVRDAARAAGASVAAVYMAKSRVVRLLKREVRILKAK